MENIKQCSTDEHTPIIIDVFDITQPERQKYALNSTIHILEDVNSHIYVRTSYKIHHSNSVNDRTLQFYFSCFKFKMNVTKCSFSQFKCEDLDTLATPNVCKNINNPNAIWSSIIKAVQPTLKCPLKAVNFY